MAVNMDISVTETGDWKVVEVTGEIDIASAPRLEATFGSEIADRVRLVVDLSDVSFIDSTGLRVLIAAHQDLASRDGRFAVVPGTGPVARLLELTGVDQQMKVHDSVDAATRG